MFPSFTILGFLVGVFLEIFMVGTLHFKLPVRVFFSPQNKSLYRKKTVAVGWQKKPEVAH